MFRCWVSRWELFLLAALVLALPGCAPANPIDNTSWKLTGVGPHDDLTPVIEGTTVSLDFISKGNIVSGSTGCNAFEGTYEADGSSLTINYQIGSGQRCDLSAIVEQEQMFLAAIVEAEHYVVTGDKLTIECEDTLLTFIRR